MSDEIAGLKILELPYEFPQNLENESAQLPFAIPNGSNARTGLAELKENFLEGARTALANETARAEAAEQANAQAIADETTRAEAAEQANAQAVLAEQARAEAAESGFVKKTGDDMSGTLAMRDAGFTLEKDGHEGVFDVYPETNSNESGDKFVSGWATAPALVLQATGDVPALQTDNYVPNLSVFSGSGDVSASGEGWSITNNYGNSYDIFQNPSYCKAEINNATYGNANVDVDALLCFNVAGAPAITLAGPCELTFTGFGVRFEGLNNAQDDIRIELGVKFTDGTSVSVSAEPQKSGDSLSWRPGGFIAAGDLEAGKTVDAYFVRIRLTASYYINLKTFIKYIDWKGYLSDGQGVAGGAGGGRGYTLGVAALHGNARIESKEGDVDLNARGLVNANNLNVEATASSACNAEPINAASEYSLDLSSAPPLTRFKGDPSSVTVAIEASDLTKLRLGQEFRIARVPDSDKDTCYLNINSFPWEILNDKSSVMMKECAVIIVTALTSSKMEISVLTDYGVSRGVHDKITSLVKVATSGSYNDLKDIPSPPLLSCAVCKSDFLLSIDDLKVDEFLIANNSESEHTIIFPYPDESYPQGKAVHFRYCGGESAARVNFAAGICFDGINNAPITSIAFESGGITHAIITYSYSGGGNLVWLAYFPK